MRVATEIVLTKEERQGLTKRMNAKLTSVRAAQRARIVLLSADEWHNTAIAQKLNMVRVQVSRWRNRYADTGFQR